MKKFYLTLTFIVFLFLLVSCSRPANYESVVEIDNGNKKIKVYAEVVDTAEERQVGLMYREHLDENAGMLFVWESEDHREFWMKNTLIPLDIFYINSDLRVIDIQTMTPCVTEECPTYPAADHAQYALEVNAGFAVRENIKVGSTVSIN